MSTSMPADGDDISSCSAGSPERVVTSLTQRAQHGGHALTDVLQEVHAGLGGCTEVRGQTEPSVPTDFCFDN